MKIFVFLFLTVLALAPGCRQTVSSEEDVFPVTVAASLGTSETGAYALGSRRALPVREPLDLPGLKNVFPLSENVISGAEPDGAEAFEAIAALGVKTILSVDGKVPDQDTAAGLGMRYVHVPLQYSGIDENEFLRIAKTFHELKAPFYVHCYHGRHRGPAAAGIGRLLLDKADREQALAEMRQWSRTSPKYEGLYGVVAWRSLPSREETTAYAWDFPAAHPLGGFRNAMIDMTRAYDHLQDLADRDWKAGADHPDVHAVNEADKLIELLHRTAQEQAVVDRPAGFRRLLGNTRNRAELLRAELRKLDARTSGSGAVAARLVGDLKKSCTACHVAYRN